MPWPRGVRRSEETRRKMSASTRGRVGLSGESNRNYVHGLSYHPSYERWRQMMYRCHWTPIENYGLRGIQVYEGWHDVRVFLEYLDSVLGPCPAGHSLDRIDNDGNYEPGNIRWATKSEQASNRRPRCL